MRERNLVAAGLWMMQRSATICNVSIVRGPLVLPAAMFLGSFSWSFAYVSLPFYIQRVSVLDTASTRRWTGWILGVSSLVTVLTAPV